MNDIIIWFDFGGVLSPPINTLFDIYFEKTGIPPEILKEAMEKVASDMGLEMLSPIENALISEREWGVKLEEYINSAYTEIDTSQADFKMFGKQWFGNVEPNIRMIEEFKRLKNCGVTVGILTNNVIEWESHWRNMVGLDDVADFIVDSSKEKRRKPEPEFYYLAERYSGRSGDKCVLIDDLIVNCKSAENRGWKTVNFINNDQAISELRSLIRI
ncbi:HAD-IA family hydrolase [Vibrio sp. S4M6]|uniref:HAD-IA family hydrolase n=1 Tax=Vibrio sinus TaxID=2946865 RepID=UPI002029BE61|nr:HAD-IA family hydrolase [Vibrio sinus]MCL9782105.1 HAD-IA family hydrolase [Vibrio sinus]